MLDCRLVIGTRDNDTLLGTPTCDVIGGCTGDNIIIGLGGNDILISESDADTFRYSALSDTDLSKTEKYHDGVDTILFFSRVGGDRIDLSEISAGLKKDLTFSGTTPKAYGVYYTIGVDPDYDIVTEYNLNSIVEGEPVTLMADFDGDAQSPEFMAIMWGGVGEPLTHLTASDLML